MKEIMEIDPHLGKPLSAISVFEPWRQRNASQVGLPLFGAIAMEFGDTALLFKSPLRYSRVGLHTNFASYIAPDRFHEITANYRATVCDTDLLNFHRRMMQNRASETQTFFWQSVLPESRHSLALDNLPDLRRLFGQTLLGMNRVSDTVFELRFSGQEFPMWLTYREDLDGAIQMAWAGWNHEISEIVVSQPDNAFGWLHPDAQYPICAMGRLWPNIGRYIESAHWQATRSQRDLRSDDKAILLAIHEQALRLKFEGHPNLARRLAACRYPIIGDGLSDVAIQALQRFRAAYSTSPAS